METSDNHSATSSPAPTSTARRSGRVTKAPSKFTPDAPPAAKRKRDADHDEDDVENESPNDAEGDDVEDEPSADEEADDSAADEPARSQKKKRPASSQPARSRKPAAKKPKINGDAPAASEAGPSTHSARLPSRPKKAVRLDLGRREGDGLYGTSSLSARQGHCATCYRAELIYLCSRNLCLGRIVRKGRDRVVPQVPGGQGDGDDRSGQLHPRLGGLRPKDQRRRHQ